MSTESRGRRAARLERRSKGPGRPRLGEEPLRRQALLDAALELLVERGYEATTTLAVAQRAGSSKETIYAWFGSKAGLFAAMIEANAAEANARVEAALDGAGDPRQTLVAFSDGLLRLLLGERALALNRAAISSPELADVLLRHGRHRTGPLVESYLARLAASGELAIDDPDDAFRLLYGLVVQDSQIRALLGERPLTRPAIRRRAAQAVDRFLALTGAPHDNAAKPTS